jgi:hypothetical protein
MGEFYVKPGDSVSFAKTVGETDIYLFAGITGDFAVNHVNEQYMARSKYGRRIAHGVLMLGFASTCSTLMIEKVSFGFFRSGPDFRIVEIFNRCSSLRGATPVAVLHDQDESRCKHRRARRQDQPFRDST